MNSVPHLAWVGQIATTLPLVGLIWFVQVVAYPLFAHVGAADFAAYHQSHSNLITLLVGPLMMAELAAASIWATDTGGMASRPVALIGLGLVALAWCVTVFVSVPQHAILARGFDPQAHGLLVATNWLRTVAWTARGILLLTMARRGVRY